ncbi:MAG: nucleotidyltransferase [Anaerovoracaceae bacterium]
MNVTGIIAEYNPFHKGHLYHLEESKAMTESDITVVVMSGNFMQRGEIAMADKWIRAESAVRCGADLVLELPFVFACNSAEYFAKGAMDILRGLQCITHISFGSENGNLEPLKRAAELLTKESPEFKKELEYSLGKGNSYPRARWEALVACYGQKTAAAVQMPNDILAVEYIKQAISVGWDVKFNAVKRQGAGFLDSNLKAEPVSATGIRNKFIEQERVGEILEYLPEESAKVFKREEGRIYGVPERFYWLLAYKVATTEIEGLAKVFSIGEGLENKLKKAFSTERDIESVFRFINTKRYTETRIRRILIHTLFGFNKCDMNLILSQNISYCRVLGFSEKGAALLRRIKRERISSLPIITNINKEVSRDDPIEKLLKWDIMSGDIYNILHGRDPYRDSEYLRKPYVHDK